MVAGMKAEDEQVAAVAQFVRDHIQLEGARLPDEFYYAHLPLCIIETIFSLGIRYQTVQLLIQRYGAHQGIPTYRPRSEALPARDQQQSVTAALALAESYGAEALAAKVFKNRCRTSTRNGILKADAVLRALRIFKRLGVEYLQDAQMLYSLPSIEAEFRAIPGQGAGISWSYLLMLAGDENLIKPDRMIQRFLFTATGKTQTMQESQQILEAACAVLKAEYTNLTPRLLDYKIWEWQRER
jgi:hypothetical protein